MGRLIGILAGKFQGHTNINLNSTGIKQAEDLSLKLKDSNLDIIYSSPLNRALETASIVNKYHNTEILIDDDVIERSLGNLEGTSYLDYNLPDLWNHILNFKNIDDTFYDVESLRHLLNRAYNLLEKIILKYQISKKNILIATHGAFIVALLLVLGKLPSDKPLYGIKLDNCCCFKIENCTLNNIKDLASLV